MENNLSFLSTRTGFNISLRHFKKVLTFIKQIGYKSNLGDLINNAIENKQIEQYQISAIINALLIDKFSYICDSFNLKTSVGIDRLKNIAPVLSEWSKFDLLIVYFHPVLGRIIINPKKEESWDLIDGFKENELVAVYIGNYGNEFDRKLGKEALLTIENLIYGKKITKSNKFIDKDKTKTKKTLQQSVVKKEVKTTTEIKKEQKTTSSGKQKNASKKKLSPQYGVVVKNELFHNGNVEAWKKIIASYEVKYPETKVLVFYDNEQIHDINTLFKWGKVKHGTMIFFRLLAPEFKDISKLRRYLAQGASHMFEAFLKGPPGQILNLF